MDQHGKQSPYIKLIVLCGKQSNIVPTQDQSKRWEDDYRLVGNAGLFDEYLEMSIGLLIFLSDSFHWLTLTFI